MLIAERRHRLLEQVRQRGYASFRELADTLGISESTVRRDLRQLVAEGLLESTRGGVGLLPGGDRGAEPGFRPSADGGASAPGPPGRAGPGGAFAPGPADGPGPAGTAGGWAAPIGGWAGPTGGWAALVHGHGSPESDGLADDPVDRERRAIAGHAAT